MKYGFCTGGLLGEGEGACKAGDILVKLKTGIAALARPGRSGGRKINSSGLRTIFKKWTYKKEGERLK